MKYYEFDQDVLDPTTDEYLECLVAYQWAEAEPDVGLPAGPVNISIAAYVQGVIGSIPLYPINFDDLPTSDKDHLVEAIRLDYLERRSTTH